MSKNPAERGFLFMQIFWSTSGLNDALLAFQRLAIRAFVYAVSVGILRQAWPAHFGDDYRPCILRCPVTADGKRAVLMVGDAGRQELQC